MEGESESVAVSDGAVLCEPCSDTEGAQPQEDEPEAVPCDICKMLLNGPGQYEDHLKSKHHRKHEGSRRARAMCDAD